MEKITVLYIDDESINLMLFSEIFEEDYNILTGKSGNEGLQLLSENPDIKVVFSDMKMPYMNGVEFISKAKTMYPDIIYFIVTGFDITQEIAMAIENKLIENYFSKPFKVEEIKEAIELAIS